MLNVLAKSVVTVASKLRRSLKRRAWLVLIGGMLAGSAAFAGTGVYVNGVELNAEQMALVYQSTGQLPAPGHYLVQKGCVAHLESGQVYCPQAAQGGGYGYNGGLGNPWFHRSTDSSGDYSVGGDGSGCIYTPHWSTCDPADAPESQKHMLPGDPSTDAPVPQKLKAH